MRGTKVMAYIFLSVLVSLHATIGVFSTSSHISQENQGTEGYAARRTLGQEEQHAHEIHCSRERSRAAWKIIDDYLLPFVEQENYQISRKCRLHPENDIFRDQEQHKIHVDTNEWRCGYCKKIFRAEKYLDQHFDNRHYNLLNASHSKCLADLCGALHCDLVMDSIKKFSKTKCNPAAAAKNHQLCETLADSCFPAHQSPSANRLHEAYKHFLFGHFTIDLDAAPRLLCNCLFVPERNEKRNPRAEAHFTTWEKNKALLVGQALGISGQEKEWGDGGRISDCEDCHVCGANLILTPAGLRCETAMVKGSFQPKRFAWQDVVPLIKINAFFCCKMKDGRL